MTVNGPMDDQGGVRARLVHYATLPLRLILGGTFLYAGIDKFTDWGPFTEIMDRQLMAQQVQFTRDEAAAPWLSDLVLDHPDALLTGVAVTEIAIGAALLIGLLTRLAGLAGAALALGFWLTVTWGTDPFYYGPDLPFLAGFLALALAGSGAFSVDAALRRRERHVTASPLPAERP